MATRTPKPKIDLSSQRHEQVMEKLDRIESKVDELHLVIHGNGKETVGLLREFDAIRQQVSLLWKSAAVIATAVTAAIVRAFTIS